MSNDISRMFKNIDSGDDLGMRYIMRGISLLTKTDPELAGSINNLLEQREKEKLHPKCAECMFQNCNHEATMTIPCIISPSGMKKDVLVCNFHFNVMRQPEPYVSVELNIKENKND